MSDEEVVIDYISETWKFTHTPPHLAQQNAIDTINKNYDDKTLFFISSGNSFGKTHLMCNFILNMCYPPEFRTFGGPLFDEYDKKNQEMRKLICG